MKKILLIVLFVFPCLAYAQSDSTKHTLQTDTVKYKQREQYCMIMATGRLFSTKVNIQIDFGQKTSLFSDRGIVRDADGNVKDFNSVIDVLNYMATQGWLFVNAYSITVGGSNILNYVMRRELK